MWGVPDGDKLVISTDDGSWKTKRINNTPRVTIQKCGVLGKVKGEPVEAVARKLPKSETRRVFDMVTRRYWYHAWWWVPQAIVRGGIDKVHAAIEVRAVEHGRRLGTPASREALSRHGYAALSGLRPRRTGGRGRAGVHDRVRLDVAAGGRHVRAGLALAGSQVRRQIQRLRAGLAAPQGAVPDGALVALGTVLTVVPGLVTSALGLLLLLPPTRAVARPLVTALAARGLGRVPLIVTTGGMRHRPAARRLHRR